LEGRHTVNIINNGFPLVTSQPGNVIVKNGSEIMTEERKKPTFCGACASFNQAGRNVTPFIIGFCDNCKSKLNQVVITSAHPGCGVHRQRKEDE